MCEQPTGERTCLTDLKSDNPYAQLADKLIHGESAEDRLDKIAKRLKPVTASDHAWWWYTLGCAWSYYVARQRQGNGSRTHAYSRAADGFRLANMPEHAEKVDAHLAELHASEERMRVDARRRAKL